MPIQNFKTERERDLWHSLNEIMRYLDGTAPQRDEEIEARERAHVLLDEPKLSLTDFRLLRVYHPDLFALDLANGDPDEDGPQPGFVYGESQLVIEIVTEKWPEQSRKAGAFHLVLGRDEWLSNDLAELEAKLYEFGVQEGCFDPRLEGEAAAPTRLARDILAADAAGALASYLEIPTNIRISAFVDIAKSLDVYEEGMSTARLAIAIAKGLRDRLSA